MFCLAPGSYDVEKAEKMIHQSSGAITFGIKYKDQKPEDIPGEIQKHFQSSNDYYFLHFLFCIKKIKIY